MEKGDEERESRMVILSYYLSLHCIVECGEEKEKSEKRETNKYILQTKLMITDPHKLLSESLSLKFIGILEQG